MKTEDDERKQEQNDEERVRQGTAEHSDEEWKVDSVLCLVVHYVPILVSLVGLSFISSSRRSP